MNNSYKTKKIYLIKETNMVKKLQMRETNLKFKIIKRIHKILQIIKITKNKRLFKQSMIAYLNRV